MIRFEKPAKEAVLFKFGHGRYADAWSILHVTTGVILGLLLILFDMPFVSAITISLVIMFMYELIEAVADIVEDVENSISDVLFGALGTILIYFFDQKILFTEFEAAILLYFFVFINVLLLFMGWRSYLQQRVKQKPKHLLPSWASVAGRKKIYQDQIIFFGFAVAIIPLAAIGYLSGLAMAAIWAGLILFTTFYMRQKVG